MCVEKRRRKKKGVSDVSVFSKKKKKYVNPQESKTITHIAMM